MDLPPVEHHYIHAPSDNVETLKRQVIILNSIIQGLQEEKMLMLKRMHELEMELKKNEN